MGSSRRLFSLFVIAGALGCTESVSDPVVVATSIQVSQATLSFDSLGSTTGLTGTVLDQNGQVFETASVGWASSDDDVASISASGLVTAEGVGLATVTGTSGSLAVEVPISVSTPLDTVEVDARLYGSLLSGLSTLGVPLSKGTHSVTLIKGNFVAWSFAFGGVATWRTHYRVYYPDSTFVDGGEALNEDGPDAAFDSTAEQVTEISVPTDQEVRVGVPDNVLWDNVGGVTLVFRHIRR